MSKRTFEDIVKEFKRRGYTVLTKNTSDEGKFFKVKTQLKVMCPKGHEMNRSFFVLKRGDKCRKCHFDDMRLTFDHVKKTVEQRQYQLKSTSYLNSGSKLELVCPNGHDIKMAFGDFEKGTDCKCLSAQKIKTTLKERYNVENAADSHITYDDVKSVFEDRGYQLKSDTYVSSRKKLEVVCPNGCTIQMTFRSFQTGYDCKCMRNKKFKRTCLDRYGISNPSQKSLKHRKLNPPTE